MKGVKAMPEYLVIIQFNDRFQYMAFQKFEIAHTYFFQMYDVFGPAKIKEMSLFKYEADNYRCIVKAV